MELRFINLNNNVIDKIENLEILSKLTIIDLGHNMISKIENLSQLSNLQTLDIANNYIETMEDIEHLKECQSLRNIDLAHNSITDPNAVEIFANMGSLKTLSLIGNPLIGKIRNYRRTMILKCKRLTALDERLIKTVERKATEAWAVGGVEAEKNVYEEDFENKRKYRKELVDDLMRNRIIIREKARAKWKKKKCKNLDHGDFENIPSEEDSFYPDLLGSEDSSLSLSGTEDLYEDLWYSELKCEGSSSKNKKQRLIFTLPSCDITTSGEECGINHTTQDEGPSKEIDKCCRYALNDDEEISNHPLSISENKNIVKTNSKTCFNIHELHNNEEDTIKTTDQHDINEYKLDKMLSREQLDQYSSDENEFFHPAFQETEIDETKVNKLFEELFLSDKDEAFNERDKNSFSEKSMQSDIQDLLKDKKPNYDNSESNIAEAPQRAKDNKYYLKNEIKDQNKSHYEQYQDMLCILNSVKQKDIMNDEMTKTNTLHHVSEIIQNHIENSYRSDITKEQEMNPSTEDSSTIEGMEEYRIRRGEEKLEQLCQTPFPYIKDKKSSMKRNLKQAKTLFLQLFK
ncbi:dynein axonemal assembly factor 1 homolog isoform X2 [Halyomorpha halys]|nr:dynein assembly factor 1, axonemal homolog isoform X2 [Halyomorpha halys]